MADKRALERVTFTHRGKVFSCVVVDRPLAATSLEVPPRATNGVWSVTVEGTRRDVFPRDRKGDTQDNVVARVIAWYEQSRSAPAGPRPGAEPIG